MTLHTVKCCLHKGVFCFFFLLKFFYNRQNDYHRYQPIKQPVDFSIFSTRNICHSVSPPRVVRSRRLQKEFIFYVGLFDIRVKRGPLNTTRACGNGIFSYGKRRYRRGGRRGEIDSHRGV